jgi:hypothetical protein
MEKVSVRIEDQKVWVGSQAIPLLSGEVHYWRLDPKNWRDVLEKVKLLGLKVVATYVCWDFHEISPGQYDFNGRTDPRRNLVGFLDLLVEMGFWIIIRPGPYIYSEWAYAGVPKLAAGYHRLDPTYLTMAHAWLEAVAQVIYSRQATCGGRIILCQAENELDCWPHIYTEALGLGSHPGLFQEFLRERYGVIEKLNEAWGGTYDSFECVRATLTIPAGRADWMPRYFDYYRFKHWYVLRGIQWTVDALRSLGIDIPMYTNTIAVHSNEPWAAMERVAGLNGVDLYPSRDFHQPGEHRKYLDAARYLRSYSCLPYVAEFEAGIWHGAQVESQVGAPGPGHYRMAAISAMQAGVVGWNWYMIANRDNWYMSPINEWGRIRPDLYQVFSQIVSLYSAMDPTTLEKEVEIAVTIDPLHQAVFHAESDLLSGLYEAGLDYDFCDLSLGKSGRVTDKPIMFYAGDHWLSTDGQRYLLDYMQTGGHLVCIGNSPRFDDNMRPLNLLEIPPPIGILGDMGPITLQLEVAGGVCSIKTAWFEVFDAVPGIPVVAARSSIDENAIEEMQLHCNIPTGDLYTVGFTSLIGKGQLTYLGLQASADLLLGLCSTFTARVPVRAATSGVSAALFRRKTQHGTHYLFATNNGLEEKAAEFRFSPGVFSKPPVFRNMLDGESFQASGLERVFLPLRGKDAAVWEVNEGEY